MLNWVYLIIYICYYILLMFYLRYITWNTIVDVKRYMNKYKNFFFERPLIFIISLLLVLLLFCLLVKVRAFLLKEIRKRYIYQEFSGLYKSMKESILKCKQAGQKYKDIIYNKPYFNRLTDDLKYLYSYRRFLLKVFSGFALICKFMNASITRNLITDKLINVFLKYLPLILLFMLFMYDCFFNNWVISKVFYYLPFYIIYKLWYNITQFFVDMDDVLNRIIYERYYEEDNVLYIGTTFEEDEIIKKYLARGLISPVAEFNFSPEWESVYESIWQWNHLFMAQRRYVRNLHNPEYKNKYVFENFEETIVIREEIFLAFKNSKED
jgi:hypothetical protein